MKWTTLNFGKHAGLSLPQIILADADWFFWAYNRDVFWGRLAVEAEELAARATAIKIPKRDPENWEIEYRFEDDGRFMEFGFVKAGVPSYCGYHRAYRLPYLEPPNVGSGGCFGQRAGAADHPQDGPAERPS
jgi:hypothetical protein